MDTSQELRIIKKYPNRRLYDTQTCRYITLEKVKELVLNYISFKVIDVKTNKEVTQAVLFQIIYEQETEFSPILTHTILENMIRFYGHPLQQTVSQFFEQSFKNLTQQNMTAWEMLFNKFTAAFKQNSNKNDEF